MTLSWKEVTEKDEYQSLTDEQKVLAKDQYFESVVVPKIPSGDIEQARTQFNDYVNNLNVQNVKPGWLSNMFVGSSGFIPRIKRMAGVGIGVVNSPLAFIWGSQMAREANPEEFDQMNFVDKNLMALGAGFESAKESIFEEGKWGSLYGEYYKSVTGKTIRQSMEDGVKSQVKWDKLSIDDKAVIQSGLDIAAPSIEILANIISDPLITFGEAARLAALQVPENFMGKIAPEILHEIKALEGLEGTQKQELQKQLAQILQNRSDYIKWWDDTLTKIDEEAARKGQPLLKPGAPEAKTITPLKPDVTIVPKETLKITPKAPRKGIEGVNEFRKSKGLPTFTAKATGGTILGVEEDEQGNIRYNIGKGAAYGLLVAGGLNLTGKNAKFMDAMSKSPAWAKVHGMIGKEARSFSFSGLLGKINTLFFDRFSPIAKKSIDTYKEARKFHSYKDQASIKFKELKDGFAKVQNDEVLLTDYIDAHRAVTRAERNLPNPNKVTLSDAKQAIRDIEDFYSSQGKDVQQLRDAFNSFQEWTRKYILDESLEAGIISQSAYDDIVKNNKFYATFEVLDHMPPDLHNMPAQLSGEYFSVANQKIIKTMKGTEKQIANPIESTVRKFTNAQETFARNKVASTFIDDPDAAVLFRPVATSEKELAIMRNQGLDPVLQGAWDKRAFDTINRFKDGRLERYVVDKEIADAMKQLTPAQAPRAMQMINAVFRAAATTVYLPFTISNAVRDALMAYSTAPVYKPQSVGTFMSDWAKGFWEGAKHEALGASSIADDYIKAGGGFGYVGNLRQAKQAKNMLFKKGYVQTGADIVTSPFKLIEKISATVELAPRLGTFERARLAGQVSEDAALIARQSTIDFNRGGTLTKVLNQWIPFLNARVQGRVTLAQALKNTPGNTSAKVAVAVGIPGMATYAWNRLYHSDLYDDIPEYIKQNYFITITGTHQNEKTGKTEPQYIVIPKGDVGQMAWNPIEYGFDKMWEKDREGMTKFLVNWLSDMSPVDFAREGELSLSKTAGGLMPPIAKGFFEDWANLKFYTGTEIVPYWMGRQKPPELQYKENTPETYKWLGKKFNISPLRLQNYASNIVAGYGREGLDPSAMVRGLTGRIMKTKGGAHEDRAWMVVKDIEQGYMYTRSHAEEMVKDGKFKEANKLLNEWNKGLNKQIEEYNLQFEPHGLKERGGIRKSYTFTPQKKRSLLRSVRLKGRTSPLERRLSRRRR